MSELFEPRKDENTSNIEGLFPPGGAEAEAKRTPEDRLAEFVGQETLGEAGLSDISVRADLAAADTRQEKINAFLKAYPDGDLVFVPGTGEAGVFTKKDETASAQSILEQVPSDKRYGEILFRKDKSEPYAKLDADFLSKGGNEVLADVYEFFADDIGAIAGEIAAGSKKFVNFINKIPGVKLLKPIPLVGPALSGADLIDGGYKLLPLLTRVGIFGFGGELTQEGIQELRGINEQTFSEIASGAGYKSIMAVGGTAALEPVVRNIGNIFKGAGFLKRSEESTEGILAVNELNQVFKKLNILDKNGQILKIDELPANVIIEPGILSKTAAQSAASGGPLSKAYQQINVALSQALKQVGDEKSAGQLIDLLQMAVQFEQKRLSDLAYKAQSGNLNFNILPENELNSILKQAGVDNIDDITMKDAAQIIQESMESLTQPGGYLDNNIKIAEKYLADLKPGGMEFDLSNLIATGKNINFGIVQAKRELDEVVNSTELEDWILTDFGAERFKIVENNVRRRFDKLAEENQTPEALERIRVSEFKNYLQQQIGKDPLINIQASGQVIENISKALRDMDPAGGSVAIPEGAQIRGTDGELVTEVSTLQFLFDQKRQLQDLLNAGPSNVSRIQKENATKLINEINNTIKNVKNADANWADAFESLIETEAKALAIRKLPIVQSLGSEGRFKELLKGYMSEDFSVSDVNMLRQTMDENAFSAFTQGFFNQIVGTRGTPNSLDNFLNVHKNLEKYDRKVLEAMFDKPTLTALDNLGGFMKKLENSNILKTLNDQAEIGPAIRQLIDQKETKKIADVLDLIKNHKFDMGDKTVTGFDTPLGQSFHDAIKNELFKVSTTKLKNKPQLDLQKYRAFIEGLEDSGVFATFSKQDQKLLKNVDLVKDFIVQGGDAGTSLEIASLAEQFRGLATGRSNLRNFLGQILELKGIGHVFTSDSGRFFLTGTGKEKFKPSAVSAVMGGVLATSVAPDDGAMEDLKFILDIGKGAVGAVGAVGGAILGLEEKESAPPNEVSRLSNPNFIGSVSPVNFAQAPTTDTGAVNPNTLARGQQLFSGPGEITFAAKGGIMNTKKAFQRVA